MKKTVLFSGIFAVVSTIILCAVNWMLALNTGEMLGVQYYGGEYGARRGLGIWLETVYPMSTADSPASSHSWVSYDPVSFIVTLLIIFVFSLVAGMLIRNLRNKN